MSWIQNGALQHAQTPCRMTMCANVWGQKIMRGKRLVIVVCLHFSLPIPSLQSFAKSNLLNKNWRPQASGGIFLRFQKVLQIARPVPFSFERDAY